MIIKRVTVDQFRAMKNVEFSLGKYLTAIAGRNATMKTTLLGIVSQPFTLSSGHPLYGSKTIDGYDFKSQFSDKFKISPDFDKIGEHLWTLFLENKGYYPDDKITIKSIKRSTRDSSKPPTLRFWSTRGRAKGDGYVQLPVYFLSLSRLFPVGEAGKTTPVEVEFTQEEADYCIRKYREILSIQSMSGTPTLEIEKETQKKTYTGISDDVHDLFTNSAGEGNVTRIILAMLSFKRIKESKRSYKGGILLIDEIETTLYPHAQKALVKYLRQAAEEFQVQVIFTTHSNVIMQEVYELRRKERIPDGIPEDRYAYNSSIVYLEPEYGDGGIRMIGAKNITNAIDLKRILNDINLMPTSSDGKLSVYTEDAMAASFVRFLLSKYSPDYDKYISFIDINLGYTNYKQLWLKGVPAFRESIILIDDGEKELETQQQLVQAGAINVLCLPLLVEKGLFAILKDPAQFKGFSEGFCPNKSFSYDICFADWPLSCSDYSSIDYKVWLQKAIATINLNDFLEFWYSCYTEKAEAFLRDFLIAYNILADKLNLDPLPISIDPVNESTTTIDEVPKDDSSVEPISSPDQ